MSILPGVEKSYWREVYPKAAYPQLRDDIKTDVVIVGAGISGLTAAYLLKKAGRRVVVLEKATLGGGTTGRTTGKVTSQHNLIYDDFQTRLGEKTARLYGHANQAAVEQVAEIIAGEKIDCDWQRDDSYVYTTDQSQIKRFKKEAETAARLGLPASYVTETPLPFKVRVAVKFTDQGKFHSQKYLLGLAKAIDGDGSHIFENSNVVGIRDSRPARVRTMQGRVIARAIIVATNVPTLPLMARGGFCFMEFPTESYIVAARVERPLSGMYISPDKQHYSILPFTMGDRNLLLIGGESHLSTFHIRKRSRYRKLANYAEEHFDVSKITNFWADRDYLSYDGPPLIGKLYPWSKHLYVASAFRKWGLSNGTVAGMTLTDMILDRPNDWAEIFKPNRARAVASVPRVAFKYLTGQG